MNITSKYFCIFNNKPPTSLIAHILPEHNFLPTEICKSLNGYSGVTSARESFTSSNNNYSSRSQHSLDILFVNTTWEEQSSLRYFGSRIRNLIPADIRNSESIQTLKSKVTRWGSVNCFLQKVSITNIFSHFTCTHVQSLHEFLHDCFTYTLLRRFSFDRTGLFIVPIMS